MHIRNCILFFFDLCKITVESKELICKACGVKSDGISTEWFTKFGTEISKETLDADLQKLVHEDTTQPRRDHAKHKSTTGHIVKVGH